MMSAVDRINALARELHGSDAAATGFTLTSLAAHIDEVSALLKAGDPHAKAEIMDIIIHALTLLRRGGVNVQEYEELMKARAARFMEKISAAQHKG